MLLYVTFTVRNPEIQSRGKLYFVSESPSISSFKDGTLRLSTEIFLFKMMTVILVYRTPDYGKLKVLNRKLGPGLKVMSPSGLIRVCTFIEGKEVL